MSDTPNPAAPITSPTTMVFPATRVEGTLSVPANTIFMANALCEITGDLILQDGASLLTPNLITIGGATRLAPLSHLEAYALTLIRSSLLVRQGAKIIAPNLQAHTASITAMTLSKIYLPMLANISGDLALGAGAEAHLGKLDEIEGHLWLDENALIPLPSLRHVGQSLTLGKWSHLHSPSLTDIGQHISRQPGARIQAPANLSIQGDHIASSDEGRRLLQRIAGSFDDLSDIDQTSWLTVETAEADDFSIGGRAIKLSGLQGKRLLQQFGAFAAANILLGLEASAHLHEDDEVAAITLSYARATVAAS